MANLSKLAHRRRTAASAVVVLSIVMRRRRRKRRNRRIWTREWILNRQRQGAFHQLMQEIRMLDTSSYQNFVRMDASIFEELLSLIAPTITYQDTVMRQATSPAERLAVTLRFLATGLYIFVAFLSCKPYPFLWA